MEEWIREYFDEVLKEFRRIRERIDSLEKNFFSTFFGLEEKTAIPLYEVRRHADHVVVCADLAGVKRKEDIDISLEEGILRIEARLHKTFTLEDFVFGRQGIEKYRLEVPLPENAIREAIRATFRKGILEVVIPLKQQRVRIKVE